ncbi:rod shape-determining protein MreC [Sandaracinobacteroides saxicola]|uniref:Cell shape-determining protein MreC n=1 Tax=Sandaracinobacteroides saxicola TaxID=2759707 RepID=A0A7G5IGE9_9SPHN|nr:rod shape-determining protein MreC [Sandaracinobacteroides saxicola]QMW22441.1 rod shape-determining protein MreC [Sandaracinobacteroides saxicola]
MAWPNDSFGGRGRRSSFARRDSNLALIGALLTGVVIAFGLLLLLMERVNPEIGARLRGGALDVVAPVWRVVSAPLDGLNAAAGNIAEHWRTVDRLRDANERIARLEAELAAAAADRTEKARLAALLKMRRETRRLVASADVSAAGAGAVARTAVVSAGLRQGVRPGMPVVAATGLAGRVIDVGEGAARILLLTDAASRVPVKVVRTGWTGLAAGTGRTLLEFSFDGQSATDRLMVGDRLVTSGDGGLFPPDVPVGVIVDVGSNPPRVRPAANPNGLGQVSIEAPWLAPPKVVAAAPAVAETDLAPPPPTPPAVTTPMAPAATATTR